jgi:VCBS repeat-containing protein
VIRLLRSDNVDSADGTVGSVVINILGTNDSAIITGTSLGIVVEALKVGTTAVSGTLSVRDVDNAATFQVVSSPTASMQKYGTYMVDVNGNWNYSLNNNHAALQTLNRGDQLTDTFIVQTADGTPQTVTILINGTTNGNTLALGSVPSQPITYASTAASAAQAIWIL